MNCPLCNVIMRIDKTDDVLKGDKRYTRFYYKCRTKTCPNYNKIIIDDQLNNKPLIIEPPEVTSTDE